jgi:ferric-dicitrate binding protein FerR (iron transport regulator)
MRRVSGDASPANMAIANWEAGGQAFAAAFAELLKAKQAAEEPAPAPMAGNARPSQKRSTERGEAEAKLIAALTKHHQYADGSCLNLDPIGNNQLAKAASVSPSTASALFDGKFQGQVLD